jgi:hypothetical protein
MTLLLSVACLQASAAQRGIHRSRSLSGDHCGLLARAVPARLAPGGSPEPRGPRTTSTTLETPRTAAHIPVKKDQESLHGRHSNQANVRAPGSGECGRCALISRSAISLTVDRRMCLSSQLFVQQSTRRGVALFYPLHNPMSLARNNHCLRSESPPRSTCTACQAVIEESPMDSTNLDLI